LKFRVYPCFYKAFNRQFIIVINETINGLKNNLLSILGIIKALYRYQKMDRLQSMRVFERVVGEGGFAAAARALSMSPAGVTRLVSDLEDHLGVRLLQRTTRRLSLTQAGEAYLAKIRHILNDIDEAHAAAQADTQEISGILRILAPPVLATHILAPVVAEFKLRYPKVLLDVFVDSPAEPPIEDYDLTLLGADAGFDADIVARPIISTYGVICASPLYLKRHGEPVSPTELTNHHCLRIKFPGNRSRSWQLINPNGGANGVDLTMDIALEPAFLVNHSDTLLRATLDGAGISGLPLDLVAAYLKSGQLKRILSPWITGRFTLYAALPSRKFIPARTRAFLELLTEQTRASINDVMRDMTEPASGLPQK
jgi:DNA-binding transcriptional LysR family regulator